MGRVIVSGIYLLTILLVMFALIGCAEGPRGASGSSCAVQQLPEGALIVCGSQQAFVANGAEGPQGVVGETGPQGEPGESVVVICPKKAGHGCRHLVDSEEHEKKDKENAGN